MRLVGKLFNLNLIVFRYFFVIIFTFFFLEISTRLILLLIVNKNSLTYGFNRDIKFEVLDLSKLQIILIDRSVLRKNNLKTKTIDKDKSKLTIWTFGGSSTYGLNCGNSSSWPRELEKINNRLIIKNFAFNGADTDQSIVLLWKNIKKNIPDIILWAHKYNIINVLGKKDYRNKDILNFEFKNVEKNIFFANIKKIDKTFKTYSLFYSLLDQIILRINFKLGITIGWKFDFNNISPKEWDFAIKNFELNTIEAIKLSKIFEVKEFFIISLFNEHDIPLKSNEYKFAIYDSTIYRLKKNMDIKLIDTTKNLNDLKKNIHFCAEIGSLIHQTLSGNKITAEKINEQLIINSKLLK